MKTSQKGYEDHEAEGWHLAAWSVVGFNALFDARNFRTVKFLPKLPDKAAFMSFSIFSGCLWVLLSTIVALLPMRFQYAPGFVLLLAAPVLLGWIAWEHGGWLFGAGLFAFVSMFRNPLIYVFRRARGQRPEIPV